MARVSATRALIGSALFAWIVGVLLPPIAAAIDPFPYELDTGRELALTGTGLALLGLSRVAAAGREPLTRAEIDQLDRDDIGGFDRSATGNWSPAAASASDYLVAALVVSPLLLAVTEPGSKRAGTVLTMYGETMLINVGLTGLLKELVGRTRPYVYNDDPTIPAGIKSEMSAVRSFPSGHTANAFTSAVFLSSVFAELNPTSNARGWVWGGSLTVASTVGYLRYRSGKHYTTDIIVGAALGALVGYVVPRLHRTDDVTGSDGGSGLTLGYGFAF